MTENEVKDKLINNQNLSIQDKIDIFNWWLKEKSPAVSVTFQQYPQLGERWLNEQEISTAKKPILLDYSIKKIKEDLGIINKSNIGINEFIIGFR